ncbi:putative type IX secretion system sortase PorU2 [Reichenbachiella ulvae]|uniref:C25 family cysteine peptidase n=1 Tax=Reichenbachiella ulvae TaxID=2980104 RepID=A0ABT3CQV7_9BACT|nr:C25 family cysteine peptidase [Reichenbachiella ulvae]MCV9385648.1 C25 family cysteine peptidase [Reichenbachiella ulvae]
MTRSKLLLWIVFILCSWISQAQPYGNEWINYNQSYYKIPIAENGIYRISRSELAAAGLPVGSIDPRKFQIFHQGVEIDILVEGEGDGSFNTNDFIAFYAEKNDGTTDTPLYVTPEAQPHTYYNIYSDSSAYFLTYRLDPNFGNRMLEFKENNVGGLSPENYFISEELQVNTSSYYQGLSYGFSDETLLGSYDYFEGWTGAFVTRNQSIEQTLTGLTQTVQDNYIPNIEILLAGGNNNGHNVEVYVGPSSTNVRLIETASFNGDENYLVSQNLEWTDISAAGELYIRADVLGVDGRQDRVAISYIKINYSKGFDLENSSDHYINLKTNLNDKSYLSFQNSLSNILLLDISNKEEPIFIGVNEFVSEFNAIVDNTSTFNRSLYTQSGYKSISSIEPVTFNNFDPSLYDYLIITHEALRANTTDNSGDQVAAYKTYRESAAGGSHTVLDLDIDQIFNQFNYGNPSPLAIKRFCEYMYENGTPEFLFLIGKSSRLQSRYYRQDPASATVRHFVPTFGDPGGDAEFTAGLDGGSSYESIPTGRINASEPDHIQAYLAKVIEKESTPYNSLRRKNLVHLSGGNSEQELNAFRSYIDNFAQLAQQPVLGGQSSQISKNNNTEVELINISDEINDGVMMVTFFGHASGSVTDIEIGLVSDPSFGYSNKGKYPTFMVNGCLAGDFFSENESFGVDWILTPDLGATAFMAHSHVAYSGNLKRYTDQFYGLAFNDPNYTSLGVGQIKAEASKRYINSYGTSGTNIAQVQLTNLQGDPAVKVFGADKANYAVNENLVNIKTFNQDQLIATIDSFQLEFDVKNFGIYDNTPLAIQVVRTFADGSTSTYGPLIYDPVLRQETLSMTIDNQVSNAAGQNSLRIEIDPFDEIEELDKTDNSATIDLFLSNGSTLNLLPAAYSIQNTNSIDFYFQSSNLMSATRDYDIQIDTTKTFNSPYLVSETTNAKVIAKYTFDLSSKGNIPAQTVFYWRTRFSDPLPEENSDWVTSSFTFDPSASEGWAQYSFDQLDESNRVGLTLDTDNGIWDFETSTLNLSVQTYGANHPTQTFEDTQVLLEGRNYFISNSNLANSKCRNNTINFLAFQRQSSAPFSPITFNSPPELNALICGVLPQYIFNFTEGNFSGSITPIDYINAMSNGDKVLIFSQGIFDYGIWTEEFKLALESLGVDRATIDNLIPGDPFIFLGVKNTGENAVEVLPVTSPPSEATLFLNQAVVGSFDTGEISTTKIGPARSWQSATINLNASTNPGDDQFDIQIIGIDKDGNEAPLAGNGTDMIYDLSTIDALQYPYLRIDLGLVDDVQFSPYQLQSWEVSFETEAEGVLLNHNTNTESIALEEGQEEQHQYTFWNISNKSFQDSVRVDYRWLNNTQNIVLYDSTLLAALAAGDSAQFDIDLRTLGNVGTSDLVLEVNSQDQPEIYLNNNSFRRAEFMTVSGDTYNPQLEVLFDGIKIMDRDIVSPSPQIRISMKDDNQYMMKEDTLGMNLYLRSPCENCDYERIAFSHPNVNWQAASDQQDFSIDYTPQQLEDGVYSLRVQVSDASGNASGTEPYEINFEVVNESTITNFYPYPNPFSSSTRFVFTLTGDTYPEDLKIQIMTISGRVVKEIFMDELGPIRIGNNLSEYAWDGRDNYGDLLANGVYLYRVMIKNPGENFEHRKTAGDKGFKNGFGKMYILR